MGRLENNNKPDKSFEAKFLDFSVEKQSFDLISCEIERSRSSSLSASIEIISQMPKKCKCCDFLQLLGRKFSHNLAYMKFLVANKKARSVLFESLNMSKFLCKRGKVPSLVILLRLEP